MTLTIPLSSETASRLREQAAAAGKNIETFVVEAIQEKLSNTTATIVPTMTKSADDWCLRLDEWIAGFPRVPHRVDDSRDSIYAGRGE